jgi:hypothetical protein
MQQKSVKFALRSVRNALMNVQSTKMIIAGNVQKFVMPAKNPAGKCKKNEKDNYLNFYFLFRSGYSFSAQHAADE